MLERLQLRRLLQTRRHSVRRVLTGENWFALPRAFMGHRLKPTTKPMRSGKKSRHPRERIITSATIKRRAIRVGWHFWQMGDCRSLRSCTGNLLRHGDRIWGGLGKPGRRRRYVGSGTSSLCGFNRQADGTMEPLHCKSPANTGMGLERIAAVLQHVNSNYDIEPVPHVD